MGDIPAFFNANANSLRLVASKTPILSCYCSIILETEPVLILNSDAILSRVLPIIHASTIPDLICSGVGNLITYRYLKKDLFNHYDPMKRTNILHRHLNK